MPNAATHNIHRGDLEVLKISGAYTQDPDSEPHAARMCQLVTSPTNDPLVRTVGGVVSYLISADNDIGEGSLSSRRDGTACANDNPYY